MGAISIMGIVFLGAKMGTALGSVVGIAKGIAWFNNKKTGKKEGVTRVFEHESEK